MLIKKKFFHYPANFCAEQLIKTMVTSRTLKHLPQSVLEDLTRTWHLVSCLYQSFQTLYWSVLQPRNTKIFQEKICARKNLSHLGVGQKSNFSWDEPILSGSYKVVNEFGSFNTFCSIRLLQTDRKFVDRLRDKNVDLHMRRTKLIVCKCIFSLVREKFKSEKIAFWSDSVDWFNAS